jgi:hypothetical protein
VGHCHHDFVEQFSSTLDHVEMTICDGIKTARVNRPSHLRKFAEESANEKPNEKDGECRMSNNEAILQHFVIRRFQFKLPKVCEIRN